MVLIGWFECPIFLIASELSKGARIARKRRFSVKFVNLRGAAGAAIADAGLSLA
jgi:hypothetical protein